METGGTSFSLSWRHPDHERQIAVASSRDLRAHPLMIPFPLIPEERLSTAYSLGFPIAHRAKSVLKKICPFATTGELNV
jgi:hypothetical protein